MIRSMWGNGPSLGSQGPTSAYRILLPHMLPGVLNHRLLPRTA